MHGASKEEQALRLIGAGLMWLILKRVAAGTILKLEASVLQKNFCKDLTRQV